MGKNAGNKIFANTPIKKVKFFFAFVIFTAVSLSFLTIGEKRRDAVASFDKEPFINPKLIEDLTTWISDHGDQVVAVDIKDSQDSNRYSCTTLLRQAEKGKPPEVYYRDDEGGEFGYQHIGRTASGIDVISTYSNGGGSGVFCELMLLSIEEDKKLYFDQDQSAVLLVKDRLVVKKIGTITLGDRYGGDVTVKGNRICIGPFRADEDPNLPGYRAERQVIDIKDCCQSKRCF